MPIAVKTHWRRLSRRRRSPRRRRKKKETTVEPEVRKWFFSFQDMQSKRLGWCRSESVSCAKKMRGDVFVDIKG